MLILSCSVGFYNYHSSGKSGVFFFRTTLYEGECSHVSFLNFLDVFRVLYVLELLDSIGFPSFVLNFFDSIDVPSVFNFFDSIDFLSVFNVLDFPSVFNFLDFFGFL